MFLDLLLWFSLTLGIQQYAEVYEYSEFNHPPVFAEIELHAENEYLDIYTIYRNEMKQKLPYFIPKQDYFTLGATIQHESLSLTVEHMCQHLVLTHGIPIDGEYIGYNRVFVTISSKNDE